MPRLFWLAGSLALLACGVMATAMAPSRVAGVEERIRATPTYAAAMHADAMPAAAMAAAAMLADAMPAAARPAAPMPQDATAADTTSVRAFWSTLDSIWHERDAEPFSRLFTEDASFAFVDRGQRLETRPAILAYFAEQFGRQRPELRHVTRIDVIESLVPDLVAIDGEVRVLDGAPDGSPPPTTLRRLAISGVLARDAGAVGGWRIRLLRAYLLSPE